MRTLLLFRGAPGCGKSTYINNNGLRPYTLSADDIRLMCAAPKLTNEGSIAIAPDNDKEVWNMLFKILDIRMQHGEFTVIDATNSKTTEMNRYKEMAEHYRYRIFCIDMTDIPIDECKRRNASREPLKRVPDIAIDRMYARFATQKIPAGIKVIKPDELDTIWLKKFDMNKYEKIVHIGDIHGCYTALMEYFKNGFNDNYMYIFLGDIIDRGLENAEVMKFMLEIYNKPNVLIIEGNHEKWLWIYANGGTSRSTEFEFVTKPQLAGIDLKDLRQFYRRIGQCAYYTFDNKDIFVSHAGISTLPENLTTVSTATFINGVGNYNDYETVADSWMSSTRNNEYQIFGHRNTVNSATQMRDRVFNLEGKVEFGGYLRIVELDKNGFHTVEIKNDVFKLPEEVDTSNKITNSSIADTILDLRKNKFIKEKKFGNISSFNFTREAFEDNKWNNQTIVSRGLYINTNTMKIVARGFNKFFNINERPETKFEMLQYTLKFPVTCYVKENGYLGLVSYNEETDDLFITTKSDPTGDYSIWLSNMINRKMSDEAKTIMKQICKEQNVTFVFESVDMENDPHIIEYPKSELYLLSIIKNDMNFSQFDYDQVVNIANKLNIKVKEKAFEIATWTEFFDWYNNVMSEDYEYNNRKIEGFVIEDSNGFMVKAKLYYYKYWKGLRGMAHTVLRTGNTTRTGMLQDITSNEFYAFCKKLFQEHTKEERDQIPRDIVTLRKMFYNQ